MSTLLLVGGPIYSTSEPFADALLIKDGDIVWLGQAEAARGHAADRVIELNGRLVTPAFVDAHVHATSAGLSLIGLDLSTARSLSEALEMVSAAAANGEGIILGHGWDESTWPENLAPTTSELDRAAHGRPVYLSRRDVHSAAVSSALIDAAPHISHANGFVPELPVTADAHAIARKLAFGEMAGSRRDEAQGAFLRHCAQRGILALHECAGPIVSSPEDLRTLQTLSPVYGIDLVSYWGQLGEEGISLARELSARPGGDLFVDGSIGSHTALLHESYLDAPGSHGNAYISREEIEDHLRRATSAGLQAGFHAIGDQALSMIAQAARAIAHEDAAGFRRLNHRIEHVEMADSDVIETMTELSMVASVQPLFDRFWGGSDRMYAERLGVDRARSMNRFASWSAKGLTLAFGSDAPVTPAEPWEWIRAALHHSEPSERMSVRAAFAAATRGGHRAAAMADRGVIAPGARAALAIWDAEELVVQAPDQRISAWSTDARSGVPPLPLITEVGELPQCVAAINGETVAHSILDALPCTL